MLIYCVEGALLQRCVALGKTFFSPAALHFALLCDFNVMDGKAINISGIISTDLALHSAFN